VRPAFISVIIVAVTLLVPVRAESADRKDPWIAMARLIRNDQPNGPGVYLKSGLVVTAAHLTNANDKMRLRIGGMDFPAKVLKQGSFEDVDLSLLEMDEGKLPAGKTLPQMKLCQAPPWPGDPVVVVDAERASPSHIISAQVIPLTLRSKFSTLIGDVATTGNSGSGVFDPDRKCLLGIMSRKFTSHTPQGDKDVAKYFVPAAEIRDFLPAEFRRD
jgi:hypothetical protein